MIFVFLFIVYSSILGGSMYYVGKDEGINECLDAQLRVGSSHKSGGE